MYTASIILHITVSIFLVIVVLLQAGKGANIGASFGGSSSQTLFGSAGPATFLGKITAACAIIFMITSLYLTYMSGARTSSSIMKDDPAVKQETSNIPEKQQPSASNTPQEPSTSTPKQ